MNQNLKHFAGALLGLSSLAVISLRADPVTVQEVGIGANEIVNISSSSTLPTSLGPANVYAGVVRLMVNGTATNGFCIDPWHWSGSGVLNYNTESLATAPKPPGPMGALAAKEIEQLWAHYYTPSISNVDAAGLQIAIWDLVAAGVNSINPGSVTFKLNSSNDYGAAGMLSWVSSNTNAPTADLIAVTGPGQDYVIQRIPDGGTTLCLLGLALMGLVAFRRKFQVL